MNKDVLVLGSGVSGLSSAIVLLKKGYSVTIWAKDFPPNTTSNMAGAFWYAFDHKPYERARIWAKKSFEYFRKELLTDPKSGCIKRKVVNITDKKYKKRWWHTEINSFQKLAPENLPDGYKYGYTYDTFVIDTSIYMDYLVAMFKKLGGKMVKKSVNNIKESLLVSDLIVNCTGLGSLKLLNDKRLYPSRGQVVKIKPNSLDYIIIDDSGWNNFAMAAPRTNDIILGGTRQANSWNTKIDPKDREEILQKCALISPFLKNVEIIGESVGLRPARDEIRLEAENFSGKIIIHNYGHGGSGFSASWGCALNVLKLVKRHSN
ncbi:MAG: FAD-dependent oxidoreductase [Candidatus Levybacteria bacterium]|nr:FAD-dependent oxidoreductase [Candidatus Levybacteria bacterium]